MKYFIVIISVVLLVSGYGQEESSASGMFSLGTRSTLSFFDHHSSGVGVGAGGQFRIQLSDRVNTEWYLDNLNSHQDGVIGRNDLHIGWSVQYYYLRDNSSSLKLMQPFFEAGHCFDYTKVNEIGTPNFIERWSSAVQIGTGTQFNLSSRFDITAKAQYMIHLGSDVTTEIISDEHSDHQHILLTENKGVDLEGHLLVTLSLNYKIGKLWARE